MSLFNNTNIPKPTMNLFKNDQTSSKPNNQPSNPQKNENRPQFNPENKLPQQANTTSTPNLFKSSTTPIQPQINSKSPSDNPTQTSETLNVRFVNLYRKYRQNQQMALDELLQPKLKNIMKENLEYFDSNETKSQRYKQNHLSRDNFGFSKSVLGGLDEKTKFKQIDNFWSTLIKNFCLVVGCNELIICQYLKEYVETHEIYRKKLLKNVSNYNAEILRPNVEFVETLYRVPQQNSEPIIDTESSLYIDLFQGLLNRYEEESMALIKLTLLIVKSSNKEGKRYMRGLLEAGLVNIFWKKYKQFSFTSMKKLMQDTTERSKHVKQAFAYYGRIEFKQHYCRMHFQKYKYIVDMLSYILQTSYNWLRKPYIWQLIPTATAIQTIDQDIQHTTNDQKQYLNKQQQYYYIERSMHLLLTLTPFCYFDSERNHGLMDRGTLDRIKTTILESKSQYLQSYRILFELLKSRDKINKIVDNWAKVPETLEWMMTSTKWKSWFAIFFQTLPNDSHSSSKQFYFLDSQFGTLIMKTMKLVIKNEQNFTINMEHKYENKAIERFIMSGIEVKGVRFFLPLLTKCLGGNPDSVNYTIHQILGIETFRSQIIEKVYLNLQLSDRQNQSHMMSMYISHNSFDRTEQGPIYDGIPEQQIKFICRMIRICCQNIGMVEELIFDSPPETTTGIPITLFLLNCLHKIKQYTGGGLKCMRYLVETVDRLFVCRCTRRAMMMGFSLAWYESINMHGTSALQEMIRYSTMKQNNSEQSRQGQKLRLTLSKHLNHIIRFSSHLSQYFPYVCNLQTVSPPLDLYHHLINKNYYAVYDWWMQPTQHEEYRSCPWLYYLLLLLESQHLNMYDYDSVQLLLEKMQVGEVSEIEYESLCAVRNVLDKDNVWRSIVEVLEPCLLKDGEVLGGMINYQLMTMEHLEHSYLLRQRNYQRIIHKSKDKQRKGRNLLIGKIGTAVQLLTAILTYINNPLNTKLIQQLTLIKLITNQLTQQSTLHHYQPQLMKTHTAHNTVTLEVNIIKVISTYLCMEEATGYPSHFDPLSYEIQISVDDTDYDGEKLVYDIDEPIYECYLRRVHNQLMYRSQNEVGVCGVLGFLVQLLRLDKGGFLVNNLNYDHYLNSVEYPQYADLGYSKLFMREVLNKLQRKPLTTTQKQRVYEFLYLCLQKSEALTYQLLQHQLTVLGDCIRRDLQKSNKPSHLLLLNRICTFLCAILLHEKRYPPVLHFIRFPIYFPYWVLRKLYQQFRPCAEMVGSVYRGTYIYNNVQCYKKIHLVLLFRCCVGLCMRMLMLTLSYVHTEIVRDTMVYLIELTPYMLTKVPTVDDKLIHELKLNPLHTTLLHNNQNLQYLAIQSLQQFINPTLSTTNSYGRFYLYDVSLAYHKLLKLRNKSQLQESICDIQRINVHKSVENMEEKTISYLLFVYGMVMGVGVYGHLVMSVYEDDVLVGEGSNVVQRVRYGYRGQGTSVNGLETIASTPQETFHHIVSLCRLFIHHFQVNSHILHRNNLLFITIVQLLKIGCYLIQKHNIYEFTTFHNLLQYLLSCTNIRFPISPKAHLLLLTQICMGLHAHPRVHKDESVLLVCDQVDMLLTVHRIDGQCVFMVCSLLSMIVNCPGMEIKAKSLLRKQIITNITQLGEKLLPELKLQLELNTITYIQLINSLITQQCTLNWISNYSRKITKQTHEDSTFNCYLLESFLVLHRHKEKYDISCTTHMIEYLKHCFGLYEGRARFRQLLCGDIVSRQFSVVVMLELRNVLWLLEDVMGERQYWTHRTYSGLLEQVFVLLTQPTFIKHILNTIQQSTLPTLTHFDHYLQQLTLPQHSQPTMHQFLILTQSLYILHGYSQTMCKCFLHSHHLQNFYKKLVHQQENKLTELMWTSVTNAMYHVGMILSHVMERVDGSGLAGMLAVRRSIRCCTDVGYDCQFVNCMLDGEFDVEEFWLFVGVVLGSYCDAVVGFVTVWKENDWKTEIQWHRTRVQLLGKTNWLLSKYHKVTNNQNPLHTYTQLLNQTISKHER